MSIRRAKRLARENAQAVRDAIPDRSEASSSIMRSLLSSAIINQATRVCCYVSFRSEVATHELIRKLLESGKSVCVPWCDRDELQLCIIKGIGELEPGTFGVLEPPQSLRTLKSRQCSLDTCQIAIVPGLAFTESGDRLGYGKGYYDRLLRQAPQTQSIALAFDCQVVSSVPTTDQDVPMDTILTESGFRNVTEE